MRHAATVTSQAMRESGMDGMLLTVRSAEHTAPPQRRC